MKSITSVMNAVESGSDVIRPPTDAEAYLAAARAMLEGARVLANAPQVPAVALSYLCGHAAESALKSMLSQFGVSARDLRKSTLRHDLAGLWERAVTEGIAMPQAAPWLQQLSRVHAAPYVLRYPTGLHGIVLPDTTMLLGVEQLVSAAAASIP